MLISSCFCQWLMSQVQSHLMSPAYESLMKKSNLLRLWSNGLNALSVGWSLNMKSTCICKENLSVL